MKKDTVVINHYIIKKLLHKDEYHLNWLIGPIVEIKDKVGLCNDFPSIPSPRYHIPQGVRLSY